MYSVKAILGRTKEILAGIFFHSKKISRLKIEEKKTTLNNISLVLIIRNEAKYIQEWIEYHKLIGVDHFYIYDNESTDDLHEILKKYIEEGIVSYIYIPGQCMQLPAYNDAIARFKELNTWMGFIDSDEFIVLSPSQKSLRSFLNDYYEEKALGINWIIFDSNNHDFSPKQGFVIENFTQAYFNDNHPINRHIKVFVRPSYVKYFASPHFCILKNHEKIVDENHQPIQIPFSKRNSTSKIRINHYFSKSKQELITKIERGLADKKEKRVLLKSLYDFSNEGVKKTDIDLSLYAEKLRKIIPETYNQEKQ